MTFSARVRRAGAGLAVAACALLLTRPAAAQDFGVEAATVAVDAPMYWMKDTSRTPIRLLEAGTEVEVIAQEGRWFRVVYRDRRFGDEEGYVQAVNIRLDGGGRGGHSSGPVSQRGFLEGRGFGFPYTASNDPVRSFGDGLLREEVFVKPTRWLQFAGGVDLRGSSFGQVESGWRVNADDRGLLRPRVAVRRLSAGITTSHFTLDAGKQFIRWGRADILAPTDRFAPRDYINVLDNDFLPILGVRSSLRFGPETFEAVWLPRMTPSRLPLMNQRWAPVPPEASGLLLQDLGSVFPREPETGFRWLHSGRFDIGASYFDGFNHLPNITTAPTADPRAVGVERFYPRLRTYGAEMSIPTSVVTFKGEAAYYGSPAKTSEEYVLYVAEVERQIGEWLLDVGYVGEVVVNSRPGLAFGAERGVGKSIIGRVSYLVDPRRTVAVEGVARQNAGGSYLKGEYSHAMGQHWRLTLAGVAITGNNNDFLGQYRRNSHVSLSLRLSF